MKTPTRIITVIACAVSLASCSTTIISDLGTTTLPGPTTTTTIPTPTGNISELLDQLAMSAEGLGQAIVDGEKAIYERKRAEADAIWKVIEPQIRESGLDLVDDVKRIINFFHTATERKRPADADKAARFLALIQEYVNANPTAYQSN